MTHGGRICILADGNIESLVLSPHFHERELLVVGSSDGEDYPGHARWFLEQVQSSQVPLQRLYEVETSAFQLPQVFEQMAQANEPPLKVLVHYRGLW
jgi:alcohol dehydrogenase